MYTTTGYCKSAALLCTGNDCAFHGSNIYCGYEQITNYCKLVKSGTTGTFECINVGSGYCNNNYTTEQCHNIITTEPVAISTIFETTCNLIQSVSPTEDLTTYLHPSNTITAPTLLLSASPTNPSLSSTIHPTAAPTINSITELLAPTLFPSLSPAYLTLNKIQSTYAPPMSHTIKAMNEDNNSRTTDGSDFDVATEEQSYGDAVLIVSIVVGVVCLVTMLIVTYFASRRIHRAEPIVEEMQMAKSIESIRQKKKINAGKLQENDYPKISQQSPALGEQDGGMRFEEYVDQEIVIQEENEVTDQGAVAYQIGDDEFIVQTNGNDASFK